MSHDNHATTTASSPPGTSKQNPYPRFGITAALAFLGVAMMLHFAPASHDPINGYTNEQIDERLTEQYGDRLQAAGITAIRKEIADPLAAAAFFLSPDLHVWFEAEGRSHKVTFSYSSPGSAPPVDIAVSPEGEVSYHAKGVRFSDEESGENHLRQGRSAISNALSRVAEARASLDEWGHP